MALFVLHKLILQTAHAQPPSGARCLIFGRARCLLPYLMCANSEGSGETERRHRLARAFAGRLYGKYHNLMSWLNFHIRPISDCLLHENPMKTLITPISRQIWVYLANMKIGIAYGRASPSDFMPSFGVYTYIIHFIIWRYCYSVANVMS